MAWIAGEVEGGVDGAVTVFRQNAGWWSRGRAGREPERSEGGQVLDEADSRTGRTGGAVAVAGFSGAARTVAFNSWRAVGMTVSRGSDDRFEVKKAGSSV